MQIYRGYPWETPDSAISQLCASSVNAAGAGAKIAPAEPGIEGLRPAQKLADLEKL
jgi:hypothetical protein